MKSLFWNTRGLDRKASSNFLFRMFRKYKLCLVVVEETHFNGCSVEELARELGSDWRLGSCIWRVWMDSSILTQREVAFNIVFQGRHYISALMQTLSWCIGIDCVILKHLKLDGVPRLIDWDNSCVYRMIREVVNTFCFNRFVSGFLSFVLRLTRKIWGLLGQGSLS